MQDLWPAIIGFSDSLDAFAESIATPIDTIALLAVSAFTIKYRNIICYIILADFFIMYIGANWAAGLDIWDNMGIFWQYGLGMKDTFVMMILYVVGANPLVLLAYGIVSVPSWSLWAVYELVESDKIYHLAWYLWSPLYIFLQVLQVAAMGARGGDDGRMARDRLYVRWRGWYVFFSDTVHNYISARQSRAFKDRQKVEQKA